MLSASCPTMLQIPCTRKVNTHEAKHVELIANWHKHQVWNDWGTQIQLQHAELHFLRSGCPGIMKMVTSQPFDIIRYMYQCISWLERVRQDSLNSSSVLGRSHLFCYSWFGFSRFFIWFIICIYWRWLRCDSLHNGHQKSPAVGTRCIQMFQVPHPK